MPRPKPDERVLARRRQLGVQIRDVRVAHNRSQRQVCEAAGMDIAAYSRIEQGHTSPLADTLIRIADAIGCDPKDFWG